jgi:hypothetical protein
MNELDAAIDMWTRDVYATSQSAYSRGLRDAVKIVGRSYDMGSITIPDNVDEQSFRVGLATAFRAAAKSVHEEYERNTNELD